MYQANPRKVEAWQNDGKGIPKGVFPAMLLRDMNVLADGTVNVQTNRGLINVPIGYWIAFDPNTQIVETHADSTFRAIYDQIDPDEINRQAPDHALDFATWLTTQPGTILVGAEHESPVMFEAYERWLASKQ